MNWKEEAKKELQNYEALKMAIQNNKERIVAIRAQKTALKSGADSTPTQGGGNKYEDKMIELLAKEERLKYTLQADRIRLGLIERGLSILTETERTVLLTFAENRPSVAEDLLRGTIGYEHTQIYKIYNHALYRFTMAEYGIPEF